MKQFVTVLIAIIIIGAWFNPIYAQEPFEYLSPRPNAELVSAGTTLAIRHGDEIEADTISSNLFTVIGSKSGIVNGETILADDNKTVIFKPIQPFKPTETVSVTVSVGLRTISGKNVGGLEYHFAISALGLEEMQEVARQVRNPINKSKTSSIHAQEAFSDTLTNYATLPADFPPITITTPASNTDEGYLFMTTQSLPFKPYGYILIFDNTGEPVYYSRLSFLAADFKKQPTGHLSYCRLNLINVNLEEGECKLLDETYREVATVQAGNGYIIDFHGFHVREDGHVLLQIYDPQIYDMSQIVTEGVPTATVIGTVLQELDPSGNVIFQWRSWDHFELTDANDNIDLTTDNIDATHINSVAWDNDGNILMSNRHLDEITKINRRTAEVIWRLGGRRNQFTFVNEERKPLPFAHQHDARRLPNGNITLYDNGNTQDELYSRGVEYAIDEENKVITKVWEYRHQPEDIFAPATGNLQRLPNGNSIIGWGGATIGGLQRPVVTEVDTEGNKQFELYFAELESSYRVFRQPWEGRPAHPPRLVLREDTLHFSWNGATHVTAYQLYGGDTIEPNTLLETVTKNGFETIKIFSGTHEGCYYYQVMPLTMDDTETKRSNPVFVGDENCEEVATLESTTTFSHTFISSINPTLLSTIIQAESGTVSQTMQLMHQELISVTNIVTSDWHFGNIAFQVEMLQAGTPQSHFILNRPITVTLLYNQAELDGLDENSLTIHYWDAAQERWSTEGIVSVTKDTIHNKLQFTTNHLSNFAVFGKYPRLQQIQDGGFENGRDTAWTISSSNNNPVICDGSCSYDNIPQSYRGKYWLRFNSVSQATETASASQIISIPSGELKTALLNFRFRIQQADGDGQDIFKVLLNDSPVFTATDAVHHDYMRYTEVTLDVTPYFNHQSRQSEHLLEFEATIGNQSITIFDLDEINLFVEGAFTAPNTTTYLPISLSQN